MLFRIVWLLAFVATPASGFLPTPATRVAPIGRSVTAAARPSLAAAARPSSAVVLRSTYDPYAANDPFAATGDGAWAILPAAAIDHPLLGRVARAAAAAVTGPDTGSEVGNTWVYKPLLDEFKMSVHGVRLNHAEGDGRFDALWYAAGGGEPRTAPLVARICGGRHWDLLVTLFPTGTGCTAADAQPEGTIQLLKPLIGAVETAVRNGAGERTIVRPIRAGERAAAGSDFTKLIGGPRREFSGVGGKPSVLFEVMIKRPVTNTPPLPLPLLELTPDLASAFVQRSAQYDSTGAAAAPEPIHAPDGSTWEPFFDADGIAYYFINSVTGESSWDPPGAPVTFFSLPGSTPAAGLSTARPVSTPAAASGAPAPVRAPDGSTWEPQYDEGQGAYYYMNSVTGEASWQPPDATEAPAPVASGAPAPVSAPDGSTWEPHYDEGQGAYYYINSATGESSWLN